MNKIITLENLAKAVEYFKGKLNGKADKSEIPASLPANGGMRIPWTASTL